ncbi:MAG: response regulator [Proteobacteria bacterium]|nr:response regulator [Pseudomonadota bacterium]
MNILIADDEFVSRKKAQKILSQYGKCDVACNGVEAVEAFLRASEEGEPYDVVAMDIQMPEKNGIEALKEIRELEESQNIQLGTGVKIVMLTASNASSSILSSFKEGCESYIVKPFDKKKLIKALKDLGFSEIEA